MPPLLRRAGKTRGSRQQQQQQLLISDIFPRITAAAAILWPPPFSPPFLSFMSTVSANLSFLHYLWGKGVGYRLGASGSLRTSSAQGLPGGGSFPPTFPLYFERLFSAHFFFCACVCLCVRACERELRALWVSFVARCGL